MPEFFDTTNTVTIMRNQSLLLYPFPLIVKIEAIDKNNGVLRALSFNYFNNDDEVNEFVEDMDSTYGMQIVDERNV